MTVFTLTPGPDTFVGGPGDNTVDATAATLNSGDSLTGGSGTNTLALYGGGGFHVDQLALFAGFQNIAVHDGSAQVYLGAHQSLTVTEDGSGNTTLYLGNGAVTFEAVGPVSRHYI